MNVKGERDGQEGIQTRADSRESIEPAMVFRSIMDKNAFPMYTIFRGIKKGRVDGGNWYIRNIHRHKKGKDMVTGTFRVFWGHKKGRIETGSNVAES